MEDAREDEDGGGGEDVDVDGSCSKPFKESDTKARRARKKRRGRRLVTAHPDKSISKLCFTKKSVPRMGLDTSAKVKEWTGRKAPKSRCKVHFP